MEAENLMDDNDFLPIFCPVCQYFQQNYFLKLDDFSNVFSCANQDCDFFLCFTENIKERIVQARIVSAIFLREKKFLQDGFSREKLSHKKHYSRQYRNSTKRKRSGKINKRSLEKSKLRNYNEKIKRL